MEAMLAKTGFSVEKKIVMTSTRIDYVCRK
jgi:hypothetical protein